jgi:cytosine permease
MGMHAGDAGSQDVLGDYAVVSVPQSQRRSFIVLAVTSGAWIINLSTIFTGGSLANGMSFSQVIGATVVGMAILAIYGLLQGFVGARYGVSTTMLARHCFGRQGAKIFGLMLVVTLGIGWYAWQLSFFGLTIQELFPGRWWAAPRVAAVWGSILMIITAMIGFRGLASLSYVAVPLVVILSLVGLNRAVAETGSWAGLWSASGGGDPIPFFTAVTIVVGNAAVGAIVFPDISRYGRGVVSGGIGTMIGYFLGGLFCVFAGAAMVAATRVEGIGTVANIPAAMAALGLGVWAFLVLVLAQWTTNDNNLYTASLGSSNIIKVPKRWHVLVMGVIGTVIAGIGIANLFVPFLIFLGTFIPPVAGVMIADYWLVNRVFRKKGYSFGPGTSYRQWNVLALVVVVVSGLLTKAITFGIAAVNAIVIAVVLHTVLSLLADAAKIPYSFGNASEDSAGF